MINLRPRGSRVRLLRQPRAAKSIEFERLFVVRSHDLSEQVKLLQSRITLLAEKESSPQNRTNKMKLIQREIDNRKTAEDYYDDSIVRQMSECVKVFPDGKVEVYFGGGYMIDEQL